MWPSCVALGGLVPGVVRLLLGYLTVEDRGLGIGCFACVPDRVEVVVEELVTEDGTDVSRASSARGFEQMPFGLVEGDAMSRVPTVGRDVEDVPSHPADVLGDKAVIPT